MSGGPRHLSALPVGVNVSDSAFNERLATARAIVDALVGIPIVVTQQVVQNLGDVRLNGETTVAERVSQLRNLGEMVVKVGVRQLRARLDGNKP